MSSFIINWRNAELGMRHSRGEDYTGHVSKAVPDQALTMTELFTRYTRNGLMTEGVYSEDLPPGIENLDLMERADMIRANRDNIESLQGQLYDQAEKQRAKKDKEEADKAAKASKIEPVIPADEK